MRNILSCLKRLKKIERIQKQGSNPVKLASFAFKEFPSLNQNKDDDYSEKSENSQHSCGHFGESPSSDEFKKEINVSEATKNDSPTKRTTFKMEIATLKSLSEDSIDEEYL